MVVRRKGANTLQLDVDGNRWKQRMTVVTLGKWFPQSLLGKAVPDNRQNIREPFPATYEDAEKTTSRRHYTGRRKIEERFQDMSLLEKINQKPEVGSRRISESHRQN